MTYKERELEICRNCLNRSECTYYVRNMSYKCQTNQQIMYSWELGYNDGLDAIDRYIGNNTNTVTEFIKSKIQELKENNDG